MVFSKSTKFEKFSDWIGYRYIPIAIQIFQKILDLEMFRFGMEIFGWD